MAVDENSTTTRKRDFSFSLGTNAALPHCKNKQLTRIKKIQPCIHGPPSRDDRT
jgi:mannitol/fructose-specific phosphotransferase system IIA component (Ntr-type)